MTFLPPVSSEKNIETEKLTHSSFFNFTNLKQFIVIGVLSILTIIALVLTNYKNRPEKIELPPIIEPNENSQMIIASPAFENNQFLPIKYSCEGQNINPPLRFAQIPENTLSLALVVSNTSSELLNTEKAIHWLAWDIAPDISELKENLIAEEIIIGKNDWQENNWTGPCVKENDSSFIYFTLYALNTKLNLSKQADKNDFFQAMQGHIIEKKELIGQF